MTLELSNFGCPIHKFLLKIVLISRLDTQHVDLE